jgi:transposase
MKRSKKKPKKPSGRRSQSRSKKKRPIREVDIQKIEAIVDRTKSAPLNAEDHQALKGAVETLAFLTLEIEAKGASIRRLRNLLFGPKTEKTRAILGEQKSEEKKPSESPEKSDSDDSGDRDKPKKKRKGHGRRSASEYTGADKVDVKHGSLNHGDRCPSCKKGKVYRLPKPSEIVRITGMAPLEATVYELERLRCNLCGEIFTAAAPEGVGEKKYDETAPAMITLLKYGCGFPFNRLERLEAMLGIPLPASTQWMLVEQLFDRVFPVYEELVRCAAQGKVIYNDDTTMRILNLVRPEPEEGEKPRSGTFTSGIIAIEGDRRIALFFTGVKHAGENLESVLKERSQDLGPPIQMSDGLSWNTCGEFETIVANCLFHARRRFVDVFSDFPDEVRHLLETLKAVYKHDDEAKKQELSDEQRLAYHQKQSGPLMDDLKKWLKDQFSSHKVEPNSSLGDAIKYMLGHWDKLTLFLREAGAPLDNNIAERALKRAILNRKNAMFFKTEHGSKVGDVLMSFIHTCELNDVNAFDYFVELQRHQEEVKKNPRKWLPWNYHENLVQ